MPLQVLRESTARKRAAGGHLYAAQRAYVKLMFETLGRLLAAASMSDAIIQHELEGFPEGLVLGFSVLGTDLHMRLRVRAGRFEVVPSNRPADLEVVFKHITHAFNVLSFQESTPQAFARQRTVVQGDPALGMRFTRCLNRVQGVTLPEFVAQRALKSVPQLALKDKLGLNAKLYLDLARSLTRRTKP